MATSPNYGWTEPDNTSLVKDGAQAMRTLGDAIDTSVWNVGFGQAGKNKVINGDFGIWQRGTTFTNLASNAYCADRWTVISQDSGMDVVRTAFTAGTAPVAGYEGSYFASITVNAGGTDERFMQNIEDVRTFAGQTITVSFWAKSNVTTGAIQYVRLRQNFGSGGSANVDTFSAAFNLTSSWTRYSATLAIPSVAGKTIGTSSYLQLSFDLKESTAQVLDLWGVQLEYGSKATPFQTASGGSPQQELAMCQRYYYRATFDSAANRFGVGTAWTATQFFLTVPFPVTMRTKPTALEQSGTATDYSIVAGGSTLTCSAVPAFFTAHPNQAVAELTVAAGLTSGWAGFMRNASTNAYLGWSAEL